MKVVLIKSSALGKSGSVVSVSEAQGAALIRLGQARPLNWRDAIVRKS